MKELSQYLQQELLKRKGRNGRYSLRSFAKTLNMDPSTLHQILEGKRQVSRTKADLILKKLGLSSADRIAVIGPQPIGGLPTTINDENFKQWPENADLCMREWLSYAVLSCFELSDFESEAVWFAKRLNQPVETIERVLKMLEENNLIDRRLKDWTFQQAALTSNGTHARESLDFVLKAYIQRSTEYLAAHPCKRSEGVDSFTGSTLSVPLERLPEAIARLQAFRREFCVYLSGGDEALSNDEVYRLNIQLFPLTERL